MSNSGPDGKARPVLLALQGGGTLGAYTAGVLDRLLEDGRLVFEGISGTSAGAVNTVVLGHGLACNGAQGARDALWQFWMRLSEECAARPRRWHSMLKLIWQLVRQPNSGATLNQSMGRLLMNFDYDPATMDPLREVLAEVVDFVALNDTTAPKLFVNATDVRTNRSRIFKTSELSADAVMASACIPLVFEPVKIDGEYYWDGGYMGNPALYPLLYECEASDVVLVQNNPIAIKEPPATATQILGRLSEVSFVSTLLRELRMIDFISQLVINGEVDRPGLRAIRMHMVRAPDDLYADQGDEVFNTTRSRLETLHALGRASGERWLEECFDDVGVKSTLKVTWYTDEATDIPVGGSR